MITGGGVFPVTFFKRCFHWMWSFAIPLLAACAPLTSPQNSITPTPPLRLAITALPAEMTCVVVSARADPETTEPSLFPPPSPEDWSLGPADAPVTFVEYTDYTTEASAILHRSLSHLLQKYPTRVRRVFRHYPLPGNDQSLLAAAAAEAAGQQGHFWEMNALLLENQPAWVGLSTEDFRSWLTDQVQGMGLDVARFVATLEDTAVEQKLLRARQFGIETGIPLMPWLLVNGKIYQGPRDERSLDQLVRLLLLEERQFEACPPFIIDPQKRYFARLQTAQGEITLELFPRQAPLAVNNFVFLARQGWFDGLTFHRVVAGLLAQSGDPSATGLGGPGYAFPDDVNDLRFDRPGRLAMASPGPNSNGSQFFITMRQASELDGRYVIFGQVLEGMDVLHRLTPRDPSAADALPDGDTLQTVVIEER
ncbi:peptidyl-prolyl cis-trans isomerase, cyclophilin family [Anaerolinea thermolimosa]|uniref:peptidylprolyl isomerase n=2 Tax=Anaerolinea thermolimosa TaxID=229919 RepID=A0A7U9KM22_9CHLR|nr:peptidylprolyl isomerase [Anaerolinea thermolimosa]GAP08365.1 peptidyl-prolyl cis-trans isomerase, cyclophilin family [Anaerolinea thermolimosa]